ncbi:MAG: ATP-binding cassette domain-containing protein, partial [Acidimicrobiales bacterium]
MTAAIVIDGVTKRFKIDGEKFDSLKDRLIHLGRVRPTEFWALKGIDLEIARGETFGLLGHNGSGKSTLLKCVAGVLQPTAGQVRTKGRMSALLELGAGFHPDLTGRENVELNGLLLGLDRKG